MPTTSDARPSIFRKALNWIKANPIITTAVILGVLALAGFLTAGILVPFILGAWGALAGAVVGAAAFGGFAALFEPNRYSYSPPPNESSVGGVAFLGLFFGALFGGIIPPIGLVALSILVGAGVFGIAAGLMKTIKNKIYPPATENSDHTVSNSVATCHTTFGSTPALTPASTATNKKSDDVTNVDKSRSSSTPDIAAVVDTGSDTTIRHRSNGLSSSK